MNKIRAVTHDGSFHADDVFAAAVLLNIYGDKLEIIRSRDENIIKEADIVFDVGRIHDSAKKRFDHHQSGGAGKRPNGIPYAAFGLIWKEFSQEIYSKEEAEFIDEELVQIIDAIDNGFELFKPLLAGIENYSVASVVGSFNKTFLEEKREDMDGFKAAVELAKTILSRELARAKEYFFADSLLEKAYQQAADKRLLVVNEEIKKNTLGKVMNKHPEVLYIVKPYGENWSVRALRKEVSSFESRKPLPKEWGGKSSAELQQITGVKDAIFCHNGRFVANAKSKEGALALAELALASPAE